MAATPRHGKSVVVLIDEHNASQFLNSVTVSASMDPADTTTFDSTGWKTFIPGLKDATMSADGLFAASTVVADDIANFLDDAHGGSTKLVVTVGLEGDTLGRRALLLNVDQTQYDIDAPVSGLVSLSLDAQASAGYRSGRWLRALAASTQSTSMTAVNSGNTTGGSPSGGVFHLHVTEERNVTTATFKAQHSTSGSTWADLVTFTAATGATFQRSTVSTTIKEQVRAITSVFTEGATGGSMTWAMAFARNRSPLL